jgi:hypothetical protein
MLLAGALSVLVIFMALASQASASPPPPLRWYAAGSLLTGKESLKASIAKRFELEWLVGTTPLLFDANSVECVGCQASNGSGWGYGEGEIGIATGKLRLTNVTVKRPNENCTVRKDSKTGEVGVLETKPLKWHFIRHGAGVLAYIEPELGSVFMTMRVEGGECAAIAGSYNLTGTLAARGILGPGDYSDYQELEFSPRAEAEAGTALDFGANPGYLRGEYSFELGSGKEFSWKE